MEGGAIAPLDSSRCIRPPPPDTFIYIFLSTVNTCFLIKTN